MSAPAPHRIGEPSPLIFHLAAALTGYAHGVLAAPRAGSEEFPWAPHLAAEAAALSPRLDVVDVALEAAARLRATVQGVEAWRAHPYRRDVAEPPVIWAAGSSRLLDYGAAPEAAANDGPPVLVVPSLINRAYVLDLGPRWSLLRWLAAQGLRPALLDWGAPGREEAAFSLEDYGARRLASAFVRLAEASGKPVALMGYCMGGTLAAGLAARAPDRVAALATVGAPWDFAASQGVAGGLRAAARAGEVSRLIDGLEVAFGFVPVAVFQALFALVDPMQAAVKFRRFAGLDPDGEAALRFAAVEDWLADGVPMTAPAAKDLLVEWQIRNLPARRAWRFLGGPVDPVAIKAPTLAFCGRRDTIAAPAVSLALPRAVPGAEAAEPAAGHVGMIVGGAARAAVWEPLAGFLKTHAG